MKSRLLLLLVVLFACFLNGCAFVNVSLFGSSASLALWKSRYLKGMAPGRL